MAILMQASHQWARRPDDERFTSLNELLEHFRRQREHSHGYVAANRTLTARPVEDDPKALVLENRDGLPVLPTNWGFGQLCSQVGAPAKYLRTLPAPMVADCLNYGLHMRKVDELGLLERRMPGTMPSLAAATGPGYGRIWNESIVGTLVERFGDGVTGQFTVPGEFGKRVDVTKDNTTLFASDRDVFVFLADERNRIEIPGRRPGLTGTLARGFFVWNSEVGAQTLGVASFLFDYVCANRIVWGAEGYREIKVRHTSGAPHRWLEEVMPAIKAYAESSQVQVIDTINNARMKRIGDQDKVNEFLAKRFTKNQAEAIKTIHMVEEQRPIETLWDVTVGATAYARNLPHQDERVDLERKAGAIMEMGSK